MILGTTTRTYGCVLLTAVSALWGPTPGRAETGRDVSDARAAAQCVALASADFSDVVDVVPRVTSARPVQSAGGSYCQVAGSVTPLFEFEVRLPLHDWNGKVIGLGSIYSAGDACDPLLKRGYACVPMFRAGKAGRSDQELIALNSPELQLDLALRSTHLLTLAGKAIVARYYSTAARRSYFMGCSSGGYQAMLEAQLFPWDYDGIVAGAPNLDTADLLMRTAWTYRNLRDEAGRPVFSKGDLNVVHRAALAQCDADDGLDDGIIGNPTGCKPDLVEFRCPSAKQGDCLTPAQIRSAERLYAGARTSDGEQLAGPSLLPGSELGWGRLAEDGGMKLMQLHFPFVYYKGRPALNLADFDFDRDHKRRGLGALQAHANPDLRRFKAAGGRLLAYQGGNDTTQVPAGIVDYYETVERTMGGRAQTQDFFRFFMVPGMDHCTGGAGAYAIDYLSYLEAWVEDGQPPDSIVGAHVDDDYLAAAPLPQRLQALPREVRIVAAAHALRFPLDPAIPIKFTRPVYPYPSYARYSGEGDPNTAASFRPTSPSTVPTHVSAR